MTNARSTLALAALLTMSGASLAAAADLDKPPAKEEAKPNCTNPAPSIQGHLGAFGDPGNIRALLDAKGICYNFTYIGEVLGNPSGGYKQGATYEGRLDINVDVDLEKLAGINGLAFHSEVYDVHGRGLSGNNLKDLFTTSYIEAYPGAYLYEIWLEQKLADGKLLIRAGQLAADTEFFISPTAQLLINSSYGWPAIFANDLPSGGPAFPLGALGARVKYQATDQLTLLAAIFDGDPAGPPLPGESPLAQQRDVGGVSFRLQDPPFVIGEAQYAYNQDKDATGLPGTVKVGYWHHFEAFPAYDQPLDPAATHLGDDSAYALVDQTIYKPKDHPEQVANVFLRVAGAPSDRNLIDFYIDGGGSYKGLIPGRPDDTFGIGAAYGRISPDVRNGDIVNGLYPLIRDYQAQIEATYQYIVTDGFYLQPDFQYVFHPGANGVGDPVTGQPLHNAAVFGLRASLHY